MWFYRLLIYLLDKLEIEKDGLRLGCAVSTFIILRVDRFPIDLIDDWSSPYSGERANFNIFKSLGFSGGALLPKNAVFSSPGLNFGSSSVLCYFANLDT